MRAPRPGTVIGPVPGSQGGFRRPAGLSATCAPAGQVTTPDVPSWSAFDHVRAGLRAGPGAAGPARSRNTVDSPACRAPNGGVVTPRAVVLVEGHSDRVALRTLADRSGRDLAAEDIEVVAMGGITNTRAFASHYGPRGLGVPLAGLYDAPEEARLRHGLAGAGLDAALEPGGLTRLGFYKCSLDLEDELIRALGVEAVEAVIEAAGEARSLRLLAGMPAQRGWRREAVLRRFLGVRSGRKARYAELLVDALEPGRAPEPLAAVLARI
jgi:hypothetical protein